MEIILASWAIIIAILLYVYIKRTFSYWNDRGVKSLGVMPIVGSFGSVLTFRKHAGLVFKDIYDSYPSEQFVGGFKGHLPQLYLFDPDLIRTIMVKDFNHFSDRGIFTNDRHILDQHLFNAAGDKWRLMRQKLTPTFTSTKMKQMFHLVVECGQDLQNHVKRELEKSDQLEIVEVMAKYTTDTIGSCAFGLRMNTMSDENTAFDKIRRKIFAPSYKRQLMRSLSEMAPNLMDLINFKSKSNELENFFLGLVKELIALRKTPSERRDFIDLMMELKIKSHLSVGVDKNEKNATIDDNALEITDDLITAQSYLFFGAGFETSSTTMSYAIREIALNPHIQDKLISEIDTVFDKYDGKLTYEGIQEMHYLSMVVDETLRKYPPLPFLERRCDLKYRIPNTDIVLDEDVKLLIPVFALHRDPKHFINPEEFNPERFSEEFKHPHHPSAYLPFGQGPRHCIAMRFGKLQTSTGLVSLLRKYRVQACERTPAKINFDPKCFFLNSADNIWLKLTQRC